jgi:hypothetical protein
VAKRAWALRALWVAMPFLAGPALGEGLSGAEPLARAVASLGLWAGWAVGVLCTFVRHPLTLTGLRVLAPAGVAVVPLAGAGELTVPGAALALATAGLALSGEIGDGWVNGLAYPNERRFLLRAPGPRPGPAVVAWTLAVPGLVAGPLLLADGRWVAGTVVSVVGLPVAVILLRALYGLARRWAVVVPAGVVLHDPVSLADPVLFPRASVASVGPASGEAGVDATQRAPGGALDLALNEPASLILLRPGRRDGQTVETSSIRFAPCRPQALLEELQRRRVATGPRERP